MERLVRGDPAFSRPFLFDRLYCCLRGRLFAGIKASAPDMKYSADQYFDKYDTQDIQVFSTLGLRKSDIEAIKKIDGVEQVQPLYSFDALTRIGASEQVFKVFSLPKKAN